ncbi:MAG: dihydroneopterin aldolase family protein [Vulcanisaeta sp.]|jgi:hypothetical protein|nr:dihydroneopterin aldolase family protein [Vulcanisaeta sp.]
MGIDEDRAKRYFSTKVSDRERAAFEAGVALGMVLHQFRGVPIRYVEEVDYLRRVIEYAITSQPYKVKAQVNISIDSRDLGSKDPYQYVTLKPENLDVTVVVEYGSAYVKARLRYIDDLKYTLAYIEDIGERN